MRTFFAAIVDAGGDVIVERASIQSLSTGANEPGWTGSFRIDRDLVLPFKAGDRLSFRMATGEELRVVISGVCLGEVFFSSIDERPNDPAVH